MISHDVCSDTLVIQPLPGIGDMVWYQPYVAAIADATAGKTVDILTKRRSLADQLLAGENFLGKVIWLEDAMLGKSWLHGVWRLSRELRRKGYQHVWVLHQSPRYAMAAWLAGIPNRWGYGSGWQRLFLNRGRFLSQRENKLHPIDKAFRFLSLNQMMAMDRPPVIHVPEEACGAIKERYRDCPRPWVVFGIGCSEPARRWRVENFATLAEKLRKLFGGTIFLLGGEADKTDCQTLRGLVANGSEYLEDVLARPLSEASALLEACDIFVGNDTGMLNLAAATGAPSVGLMGQKISHRLVDESRNIYAVFPIDTDADSRVSPMQRIPVEHVVERVRHILDGGRA